MIMTQWLLRLIGEIHKQVWEVAILARTTHKHVNLHVTDWVATHWEDPVLKACD